MPTVSLAELKERIRTLEGGPRVTSSRVASGVSVIDDLVGGLARPGLLELCGSRGTGTVGLALALAAAETRGRRRVAWVDGERSLYPPTAADLGVDLDRLLIVRPGAASTQGEHPCVWATEQILRAGCFRLVISVAAGKLPRFVGQRWRQAAEHGGCSAVVITRVTSRNLSPDVRLQVGSGRLVVARDRQRGPGAIGFMPAELTPGP